MLTGAHGLGGETTRIGDDNLVISTDYPHIDAHFPHALDEFLEIEGLSDNSRKKILWDNCTRLYGVP